MAEAEATAKRLLEQELVPDLLLASPARRTQQTADIIAREHGFGSRRVKRDEHLYLAAAEDILKVVRATGPKVEHLAVVGHNPGISELLKLVAPDCGVTELATGACVHDDLQGHHVEQHRARRRAGRQVRRPTLGTAGRLVQLGSLAP